MGVTLAGALARHRVNVGVASMGAASWGGHAHPTGSTSIKIKGAFMGLVYVAKE